MKLAGILTTYIFVVFFCTGLEAANNCSNLDDSCLLPEDSGPCRAAFKRYFFDKKNGQCKQFIYGGCQGNKNNFPSLEDCQLKCPKTLPRCLLPMEPGPCYGYFSVYYYNACTGNCERFIYGGCLGNKNKFWTMSHCHSTCVGNKLNVISPVDLTPACQLPKETGPCRAFMVRWSLVLEMLLTAKVQPPPDD
ncbi:hypothetical protein OS493_014044 [Desmophyllum pertusum]|uniref:BPTI/Kunitz inhibitor domain-containing protein n=1 Tax=Desmophyllum pertusum TaxID=174260 RepID=A0A9X0CZ21_9CNID|nr:hypothetical protein OS493_014044 [Desmophyllum pertusum]